MTLLVKVYGDVNQPHNLDGFFSSPPEFRYAQCETQDTAGFWLLKPNSNTTIIQLAKTMVSLNEAGHKAEVIIK